MTTRRTYGRLELVGSAWFLEAEPHVLLRAKRIFQQVEKSGSRRITLRNTPEICRDLEWFAARYALDISNSKALADGAAAHRDRIASLESIIDPAYVPKEMALDVRLRDYQRRAVEIYLAAGSLLLADDVGLGKTAAAIGSFADSRTLPAVVVTLAFLPRQWEREINRFASRLSVHVVKKMEPYDMKVRGRGPDVVVINYHKLAGWAGALSLYARSVVFDEIQELRSGSRTIRYTAARELARAMSYRLGLSATPIYNYGGEIWNILDVLREDSLGASDEFHREWCAGSESHRPRLQNPAAFGHYLRENFLMLRRTRKEVGRELPPLQRICHAVDSDASAIDRIKSTAGVLARMILERAEPEMREERWRAHGEFDMLMRQATGVAKAPYVADFVRLLVESGEQVLLYGWHREVYGIWEQKLKDLNPVYFTGGENPAAKEKSREEFVSGKARVMFMSLRSGAGLDGLQKVCKTVVFGELDWSPGVHEQCVGRILRDGQREPVAAYFLMAEEGSDPVIADVLGLKREQAEGIRNPDDPLVERMDAAEGNIRKLAAEYLARNPEAAVAG